jgi:hypothetical protein
MAAHNIALTAPLPLPSGPLWAHSDIIGVSSGQNMHDAQMLLPCMCELLHPRGEPSNPEVWSIHVEDIQQAVDAVKDAIVQCFEVSLDGLLNADCSPLLQTLHMRM